MRKKILFLAILSILACEHKITTNAPHSNVIPVKLRNGYSKNQLTGAAILSLYDQKGKEVKTGIKLFAHSSKVKLTESKSSSTISYNKIKAHTNHFPIHAVERLLKGSIKKETKKQVEYENSFGKKIVTGKAIAVQGSQKKLVQTSIIPAGEPKMKDNALYHLEYLDVEQGLKCSYIRTTLQDKKGHIWIGTDGGGICRYDGTNFVNYTEKEGLSNNYIWSILEDKNGAIWCSTYRGGICKFDGTKFIHYTSKEGFISDVFLYSIKDKKNNLWFGSQSNGIAMYDGEKFTFYTENEGLNSNDILSLMVDINGNVWAATNDGINKFDGHRFIDYSSKFGLESYNISSMIQDRKGNYWFGTDVGLIKTRQQKQTVYTSFNSFNNNHIKSVIEDKRGNIWIGTEGGGITKFDGKTFYNYTENEGLSNNSVLSVFEDQDEKLWIGTYGGGLNLFDPNSFQHFTNKESLSNHYVWSIVEDQKGNYWFGTDGGINIYDGTYFGSQQDKDLFSEPYIMSVFEDKMGAIWVGSYGSGAAKISGNKLTKYDTENGLVNNNVRTIYEDRYRNIWFTTEGGVSKFDGKKFVNYTLGDGLTSNQVWSIIEDHKGNYWFGNYGGGITKFDGKHFTHYTEKEGLSDNTVLFLFEDSKHNIWVCTEKGGLNKFDGKNFVYYTEKEGLSNNFVWSIAEDKKGNFFVSTENGLNYLVESKETKGNARIYTYKKEDGLKGLDFCAKSVLIDSKNNAWWGNGKSLVKLDLNNFRLPKDEEMPTLVQLNINERFVDFRNLPDSKRSDIDFSGVKRYKNYPLNLTIDFRQNHLTFHYACINFSKKNKIRYQFKLEGLEQNWNPATNQSFADYRNIPHGSYTFLVRACGESREWSKAFAFSFTILPPWWHTWWFRMIILAVSIFLLWQIYLWRTRALRLRQKQLEQIVDDRTADLKKEKKIVEEKNAEILDSITYAKRIQSAILPQPKLVKEFLEDSFVLYKPKDIVAGDFYWLEVVEDTVLFAAADCTGHGVPGAMVSVVCNNGLNRAVREHQLVEPDQILNKTRQLVVEEFEKSDEEVRDGMDISLCALNLRTNILKWSGANNPLWILRNRQIIEFKADKQPIGKYADPKPFTLQEISLEKGDSIYIFTDGFQDQFGGPKEKKFRVAQMKDLFLSLADKSMEEQRKTIDQTFESWKGELEQIDDVCVIGVRIN